MKLILNGFNWSPNFAFFAIFCLRFFISHFKVTNQIRSDGSVQNWTSLNVFLSRFLFFILQANTHTHIHNEKRGREKFFQVTFSLFCPDFKLFNTFNQFETLKCKMMWRVKKLIRQAETQLSLPLFWSLWNSLKEEIKRIVTFCENKKLFWICAFVESKVEIEIDI